jgi:hypothetical protein
MTFKLHDLERNRLDRCGLNSSVCLTKRRTGPVSLAETWQTPAFTTHADAKADGTRCNDAIRWVDLGADEATWGMSAKFGDWPEPERRRPLMRLWLRNQGGAFYNG